MVGEAVMGSTSSDNAGGGGRKSGKKGVQREDGGRSTDKLFSSYEFR